MSIITLQKIGLTLAVVIAVFMASGSAYACEGGAPGTKCAMPMTHAFGNDGTAGVYGRAMEKMHMDMGAVPVTGDPDVDFVTGMIPHHQGAIDMAKILKEKGKDPMLLKMADDIIKAQESEIIFMKKWLAEHTTKPE